MMLKVSELTSAFWDMHVYSQAVLDKWSGLNPYNFDNGLLFVYHQLVLKLFWKMSQIIPLNVLLLVVYAFVLVVSYNIISQSVIPPFLTGHICRI